MARRSLNCEDPLDLRAQLTQWCHRDVGGAIAVRAFELQHDVAGAVELELIIGDGGAGDIVAELLELVALIHGTAHFGVKAESLRVGTEFLGRLRIKTGDGLQAQYFLPFPRSEGDAAGKSGRLQRRHSGIRLGLSHEDPVLLFRQIAEAGQ